MLRSSDATIARLRTALLEQQPSQRCVRRLLQEIAAGRVVVWSTHDPNAAGVPARDVAETYSIRAESQRQRGADSWRGMDALVDALRPLGQARVGFHGLSSSLGIDFLVFELLGAGSIVGVVCADRTDAVAALSPEERIDIRRALLARGWSTSGGSNLMAPLRTMWLSETLWDGDLDDLLTRMRGRRARILGNLIASDEPVQLARALSDTVLLVDAIEEVYERRARPRPAGFGDTREPLALRPAAQKLVVPSKANQDRAAVFDVPDGLVLVIADGAGGTSNGAYAADSVVRAVRLTLLGEATRDWCEVLRRVDRRLMGHGWTTAVVVEVRCESVHGASVGDSRAWLARGDLCRELTELQLRKPLLGSGKADPVAFSSSWSADEMLLLATDGLCDHVPLASIGGKVMAGKTLGELVDTLSLPSGGLPDDVAVISCCLVEAKEPRSTWRPRSVEGAGAGDTWHAPGVAVASRAEQAVASGVRSVVAGLAVGEIVRGALPQELLGDLEYYVTELVGGHCDGWPRGESLDGVLVERASKRGELGLEIRGTCIFIDDQTETALWLELSVDAEDDRVVAAACRVGVPDEDTGEMVRAGYGTREARRLRALVVEDADVLVWMLQVTVEGGDVSGRSRTTRRCDECQSLYFAESSAMAALCPECAHQLYGYPRCDHDFRGQRCVDCFWAGSASDYLRGRQPE